MTSQLTPSSWLPYISKAIIEAKETPLISSLQLTKEKIEQSLYEILQIASLTLELEEFKFMQSDELLAKIGSDSKIISFNMPPLEGNAHLIFDSNEFTTLLNLSLNLETTAINSDIVQAYQDFFFAKIMQSIESSNQLGGLSLKLAKDNTLPKDACLTLEGIINTSKAKFPFYLVISPFLRKSLKDYQIKQNIKPSNIPPHIPLDLSCAIGKVHLSLYDWQNICEGDFIIIDSLGFDLLKKTGNIALSYKNNVLFYGKLNDNTIKISQSSAHSVEAESMTNDPSKKKEANEEDKDSSFFLGEDDDFYEEDEDLKKLLKEEHSKLSHEEQEAPSTVTNERAQESEKVISKVEPKKIVSPQDIPLNIKIEIANLTLTAKELLEIQPGNEFPLGKDIDGNVNLMVSGTCIARGELIKIGDILGVRILSL